MYTRADSLPISISSMILKSFERATRCAVEQPQFDRSRRSKLFYATFDALFRQFVEQQRITDQEALLRSRRRLDWRKTAERARLVRYKIPRYGNFFYRSIRSSVILYYIMLYHTIGLHWSLRSSRKLASREKPCHCASTHGRAVAEPVRASDARDQLLRFVARKQVQERCACVS